MEITIAGLPFTASGTQAVAPTVWSSQHGSTLTGEAGARTDLFVDPATGKPTLNAPRLLTPAPEGDFQFSARVTSLLRHTFDAGALLLWAGDDTWAKLAFEYAPQQTGMVVSVVTRGRSDDANAYTVDGDAVGLRVSRVGPAYAFHASIDAGVTWDLVRHFSLGGADAAVGFEVQSPMGDGCGATFTDITFTGQTLADLRDGR